MPSGGHETVLEDVPGQGRRARRLLRFPSAPARAAFEHLLETAASVGHPALVVAHERRMVDDHTLEVVRTAVAAPPAADAPPAEVRAALDTLASLVEALHAVGVAHGGLHEGNVFLGPGGSVQVTDVGIAAATGRVGRRAAFDLDRTDLGHLGIQLVEARADGDPDAAWLAAACGRLAVDGDLTHFRAAIHAPPPPPEVVPAPTPDVTVAASAPPAVRHPQRMSRPGRALLVALAVVGVLAGATIGATEASSAPATPAVADPRTGSAPCGTVPGPTGSKAADLHADVDGDGCTESLRWVRAAGELVVVDSGTRFRIGGRGDQVVIGDWDCDGIRTAALFDAATGTSHLFDGWAGVDDQVVASPGPTLAVGATAVVRAEGGCDRLVAAD